MGVGVGWGGVGGGRRTVSLSAHRARPYTKPRPAHRARPYTKPRPVPRPCQPPAAPADGRSPPVPVSTPPATDRCRPLPPPTTDCRSPLTAAHHSTHLAVPPYAPKSAPSRSVRRPTARVAWPACHRGCTRRGTPAVKKGTRKRTTDLERAIGARGRLSTSGCSRLQRLQPGGGSRRSNPGTAAWGQRLMPMAKRALLQRQPCGASGASLAGVRACRGICRTAAA